MPSRPTSSSQPESSSDPDAPDRVDAPPTADWSSVEAHDVARRLEVDPTSGLSSAEATRRIEAHGPNRLVSPPSRPAWRRFADQFRSTLVAVLAVAALVSALVGDLKDPIVIGVVLMINAVLGFVQEGKAENALAALEEMLVARVRLRRDGHLVELDAPEVVPGDIVLLEAGDRVPADGRLVVAVGAAIDESALTGESAPVDKVADPLPPPADGEPRPAGDRINEAFMNSTVVRGRAELLVTATGMGTETGRVAELLGEEGPGPTPLQQQLDVLGKRLAALAVLAVAVVFGVQLYQGSTFADAAIGAVALAVAAIPEGLPAVVTVTLAVGVHQLAMRNAIVKRLASVETLGATTVICSDKTGTLTRNEMSAEILVVDGRELDADDGWGADVAASVLEVAVLCNEAERHEGEVVGDPTETALLVLAEQHGVDTAATRAVHPRSAEIPFDSTTKWMATFHRDGDGVAIAVKGAPDALLTRCRAGRDGSPVDSDGVAATNERLAGRGLRVLAMASRSVAADDFEAARSDTETGLAGLVDDLTFEGLVGIVDPPRMEAADAIELCRRAGVSVKMITGDHAVTAGAIAERLGIEGEVITGAELERMDDDELERRIDAIGVCARVSPEHKVRVVQALQANGHVVAMTGDGVNDAAALRRAEIGVAMGITGTEVTKEAGDMILADDNFATIVGAVERGRAIYDNIVKFVRFQLTTNLAAIGTFLVASLTGLPIPFTALQVLYVNLIADGPPAMSLGVDRPDPGVMDRPPRQPGAPILTGARIARLLWAAGVMVAGTLAVLVLAGDAWGEAVGQTMAFTTFVAFQMVNVLNARSEQGSVLDRYTLSNRALWLAIGSVLVIQVLIVQLPVLESLFDTVALSAGQWAICVSVAFSVLVAEEARKAISRALSSRRP